MKHAKVLKKIAVEIARDAAGAAAVISLIALSMACSVSTGVAGESPDTEGRPLLNVTITGGIAALLTVAEIDSTIGRVYWSMGPLCAPQSTCQPRDSVEGQMSQGAISSLYARTSLPEFRSLKADYGTTPQGADMQGYLLTIRANGKVRTLRADDGTMPPVMAGFVMDLMATVREAVGR